MIATTSVQLFSATVSSTGAIIQDALPFLYLFLGAVIAFFALSSIIHAFRSAVKKF